MHKNVLPGGFYVLSEFFLHLPLRPIFRQLHPNFRGGRNANASEIWAQLTKKSFRKIKYKKIPRVHLSQNQAQKDSGRT